MVFPWYFVVLLAGLFVADICAPLDVAMWLLYLIPMLFAHLLPRPNHSYWLAGAETVLVMAGLLGAPAGLAWSAEAFSRGEFSCFLWVAAARASRRMSAENALRGSRRRLKLLSRRVIVAQETERRRIARELHDEIGQVLTAISINLQIAKGQCGPAAAAPLEEGLGIVAHAIQQVRAMSLDLRPSLLDDLGLAAALRWYLDRQAERAGFSVRLIMPASASRLPPDLETACFRVTQETVTNVVRHANAHAVSVGLRYDAETVELDIRDDGVGFDVEAVGQRAAAGGCFGLFGMRERVELLGGRFTIQSAPGQGTAIQARLPLNRTTENMPVWGAVPV